MGRDERIYEEAAALWRQLYGEPPPAAEGSDMLGWILGETPAAGYDRLTTPHLRTANIAMPKR